MDIHKSDTAVVFIDPQNDVLREDGTGWEAVGASVTENKTIENMEQIFQTGRLADTRYSSPPITSTLPTTDVE